MTAPTGAQNGLLSKKVTSCLHESPGGRRVLSETASVEQLYPVKASLLNWRINLINRENLLLGLTRIMALSGTAIAMVPNRMAGPLLKSTFKVFSDSLNKPGSG